jgi:hypothetical protein
MKAASFDPAKLLTLYFRTARAASKKFIFQDADGDPFDISSIDFSLNIKRWVDGASQIELTVGQGLTVGGGDNNELTIALNELLTDIEPSTYFWELQNTTIKKTWLNGDAHFHRGRFDDPGDLNSQIVISTEGSTVEISIAGDGSTALEHFRGSHDLATEAYPATGGTGAAGVPAIGDNWYGINSGDFDVEGLGLTKLNRGALLIYIGGLVSDPSSWIVKQ